MPTPPARRLVLVLTGLLASALLAPIVASGSGSAATALPVKAPIHGLIDRLGEPDLGTEPYISAYVVKVGWADLQPTAFGPIVANNAIDQAIARVRMPDMAGRMSLKLRVLAGIYAPEWAKQIGGAPLPFLNNQVSTLTGGTIGRFWLSGYGAAYNDLQRKLAHKYDAVPEIRELTVDRCTTLYDETFVRQQGVQANVDALLSAGYTAAADQQCIKESIDAHRVWRRTTSDVAFAPFPSVLGSGSDLAYTLSVMDYCRATLGPRCGLENNALSTEKLADPKISTMYAYMSKLGGAVTFQTATADRIGDWSVALQGALTYHANSVELPYGYDAWPAADLTAFDTALKTS